VESTAAKSDITIAGQITQKTDTIDPDALLLLPTTFSRRTKRLPCD
jgi:hypothetical protein